MLTKDDFFKLKKIIRDEVEAGGKIVRNDLGKEIRLAESHTRQELEIVNTRLKNLENTTDNLQKDITVVKKDVKYLKKELKFQSNILDKENIKTLKRVKIIEENLKIPSPDFV